MKILQSIHHRINTITTPRIGSFPASGPSSDRILPIRSD
jgi:hypothetical protein